jgi:rhamnose transport system ATP-binding protein
MPPLLEVRNLTKRYPGVQALAGVSLALHTGCIHALVGENGAGKSTLIKILAGLLTADEGAVLLQDNLSSISSPSEARRLGIAVVHQHTHLIPDLTIAENYALRLGYPLGPLGNISWPTLQSHALRAVHSLLPSMDVLRQARSLGGVEKQLVELSLALASAPRILILDEPTSVLPHDETGQLFEHLRKFVSAGGSVLFVSHRLDEVFKIADDVTVLRDGQRVWRKEIAETDHDDLIRAMVGRAVDFRRDENCVAGTEESFRALNLEDSQGAFKNISLKVNRGEIYGIYGLVGSGQSEFCQALLGLRESRAGSVQILNRGLENKTPPERVQLGVSFVPADRISQGLFYKMSVGENLSIATLDRLAPRGWIHRKIEQLRNEEKIQQLHIRTLGVDQSVTQLSGGNQQKVLLGRWLQTEPAVLILEEPTQGVDVGAKGEIHKMILGLAKEGVSILLISSEIPELLALAHRIGVMREGRLLGEMDARATTEEDILRTALPDTQSKRQNALEAETPRAAPPARRRLLGLISRREASLALFIAALMVIFGLTIPSFMTWRNLSDVLVNNSILLIGALGMTLVIISGGIDVSVGAILGLSAVAAGKADQAHFPAPLIAGSTLLVGLLLGSVNGFLSVLGRIHPIVITLGTLFIFRGAIVWATGGYWLNDLSPGVTVFGQSKLAGVPVLLVVGLSAALASHLFLKYLPSGRRLYALGGDRDSAEVMGIYPRQVVPLAFGLSGLLMGLAGLLEAGRFGQVQTNVGVGDELKFIAAAVIGGTHIMGGRGSALGTLLGAMLIGIMTHMLGLARVSAYWEGVVVGAMILLALGTDVLLSRHSGKAL